MLTFGEKRVRTTFNPSDDSKVQQIKERAAEFINYINDNLNFTFTDASANNEAHRLKSLALTSIEEGAMWAVKAATSSI